MSDIAEHIAIIGMVCRFPGAKNIEMFWQNLRDGVESVSFFTNEELVAQGIAPTVLNDPNYVKANAVLEDIDLFDASFFGLTPREAEMTDPQHRLFLECAAEVLESSGYNPDTYAGRIGVYAGAGMSTYLLHNLMSNPDVLQTVSSFQLLMGSNKDFMPTRVSYKLNLTGPSVNVSTACSTSLVAVQMACQSLLDYHCDMALAGGVGIQVPQQQGYLYQESGINSPDGHCRAFDAQAKGTVNGSGVGIVVLKRLEDALKEGDFIHAVIIGSAVNNDGAAKVGYTAPSVAGQTEVIAEAQAVAKVHPETISYIETHGTGTTLGDPIEIEALTQAFRLQTQKKGFCAIGSVKSNFGHLDEAAGIAGLIKTVLALKHHQIPPSLHFEQPNPEIDFTNSPFFVNNTLSDWQTDNTPRRAGVSSFGIGGTNAHVLLEEAPLLEKSGPSRSWQLLMLSAKTRTALDTVTINLATYLKQHPSTNLADTAYTLHVGRKAFNYKRIIFCQTTAEAIQVLESLESPKVFTDYHEPQDRPIAFMFSGQGTQYVNMGLELYQTEPTFRKQIDICAAILKPLLKLDLRQLWYPHEAQADKAAQQLEQTAVAQPALFVIEYALAQLWMAWGVHPQAMIGHSIGEYVAACLAGVFSLEEALALVAARGQLMQQLPHGAMLAVPLSYEEVQSRLSQELDVAAINAIGRCVVSGPIDAINRLETQLNNQAIAYRRLHTSHAFHSQMMNPILESFKQRVKQVRLQPPKIPYISNITGTWITPEQATDPNYYAQHLRQTVRFADGIQQLLLESNRILLEVGAGRTLTTFAQCHPNKKSEQIVLSSIRHPQDNQSDVAFLLMTLGQLWLAGVKIDWTGFYTNEQRHRLPLPTYPFERQRYWIESPKQLQESTAALKTSEVSALQSKKSDIAEWFYIPSWKRSLLPQTANIVKTSEPQNWLFFIDECNLGTQLAQRLQQAGQKVITVQVGVAFTQLGENTFSLNPENAHDYQTLFRELHIQEKIPKTIVHLWNVTTQTEAGIEGVEKAQYLGFYSLLFLAQALDNQKVTDELVIAVVSNDMQAVAGKDLQYPEKSTILGPVRVIPKEYPNIKCRSIDVVLPQGSLNESKMIDHLIGEITLESDTPIIAYRDNERWTQDFELVRLSKSINRLRDGGVYLITGGLGSMGLAFAKYIAQQVQAKLVLIGRSEFPTKDEWEAWLSAHKKSKIAETTLAVKQEIDVINEFETELEKNLAIKGLAHYEGLQENLDDLCANFICHYYLSQTIALVKGKTYHQEQLKTELGIMPPFEKFYNFFLNVLAEDNILTMDNETIEFLNVEQLKDPAILKKEFSQTYPEFQGIANILEHCARHYGKALRGEIVPITVLYPDGMPGGIFEHRSNKTAEYANDRLYITLLGEILSSIAKIRKGTTLKILEVGGGAGGLTHQVLESLKKHDIEYHFTDIGKSFVLNAQKEASKQGFSYMKFGLFDISKDPEKQGYRKQSFDIVIGYNVIHATKNIEKTTANLLGLLVPGGLMFLVETVKQQRWDNMIWGLAEGWWYFEDEDLRKDSPLLSLDKWEQALKKHPVAAVMTFPDDEDKRKKTDAGLVVVRQAVGATKARPLSWVSTEEKTQKTQTQILKLKEIENLGSEVVVIRADVSDYEQMQSLRAWVFEHFGTIHGVIHTAGILGQGLSCLKTVAEAKRVLAPKVRGTYVLNKTLKETKLDFFILCSSLSSIFPIVGQIDYCAANAFLDAFAFYNTHQNGIFTLSIDWGVWQELGMIEQAVISIEAKKKIEEEIKREGWSNVGIEAFSKILTGSTSSQIIVSPVDFRGDCKIEKDKELALFPTAGFSELKMLHPLFDRCVIDGPTQESYIGYYNATKYWVLDEHRLMGKAILPGTAYLEMVRAAFENHLVFLSGGSHSISNQIEIREIYFLSPLILEEGEEREVRTILKQQRDVTNVQPDVYDFFVVSRLGEDSWQEHTRGEVTTIVEEFAKHEITALEAECSKEEVLITEQGVGEITEFETRLRTYGPRWINVKWAKFGINQGLALLELPREFDNDIGQYKLHPALLDIATGFMYVKEKHGCLPFWYKCVKINRNLPQKIYSHVKYADSHQPGMFKYDITIMDEMGAELVEIKDYALKEVKIDSVTYKQLQGQNEKGVRFPEKRNFYLEISSPGALDTLTFRPSLRRKPGQGEVEIEVFMTGLNFIEVLSALGMLSKQKGINIQRFGLECAGKIAEVGEGVEDFKVGDEVIAFSSASLSRFTTTKATTVAHKPTHLNLEEAATIPAAFTTAYYALITLGRLSHGERILIHSAAGGVGMAAVTIAKWIGAEIFATAGSPEKRQFLQNQGIEYVMDSRTLIFADEIMKYTNGKGVNVVLNALGGKFIPKSLSVLARYGRFLELGKRDFINNSQLGLAPFINSLSFFAIDVGTDLPCFNALWQEIIDHLQHGHFNSLPYRVFPISEVVSAFEYMVQARHIGKVLISLTDHETIEPLIVSEKERGVSLASIIGITQETNVSEPPILTVLNNKETLSPVISSFQAHQRSEKLRTSYVAPRNEIENTMANIWQELLGISQVGIHDNFFDLMGDSLLGTQLISQINKTWQVVLSLRDLFEKPTIAELAIYIATKSSVATLLTPIKPIPKQEYYELSHGQQRLWVLSQQEGGSVAYNQSYSILLKGKLDIKAFQGAFSEVVQRHESLRTTFITIGGQPRQKILPKIDDHINLIDLTNESQAIAVAKNFVRKEATRPFNLEKGPLLIISLLKLAESQHVMFLNMHHIISDGWSLSLILQELSKIYEAIHLGKHHSLPELHIHYKDYVSWQKRLFESEAMAGHRDYWLNKLSGEIPVLNLPTDFPRPPIQTFNGDRVSITLYSEQTKMLKTFNKAQGVSLFMTILASVKALLYYYTGQEDIIVGSPIAGRNPIELENQIGFYLNNLALRDQVKRDITFETFLRQVRQTVIEAFEHQIYPFDKLVDELDLQHDMSHSPLFDVMVNRQLKSELFQFNIESLSVLPFIDESPTTVFDLNFMVAEVANIIQIGIEYNTDLFERDTVQKLSTDYAMLLEKVINQPSLLIKDLRSLLTSAEESKEKTEFIKSTMELSEEF
jgi:acyl transferase domain-containing protein/NADPH:quinone reductase-like Zn-dependent oxidoreductase/acyl carrier protein